MQALIDTITKYWDAFINYFNNVFISLKLFLLDLPLLAFEKAWSATKWLLTWASDSISSSLSGPMSLASNMQSALDSISSSPVGQAVMYCLQRSQLGHCFQILTVGLTIWSTVKVIRFIKSMVPFL